MRPGKARATYIMTPHTVHFQTGLPGIGSIKRSTGQTQNTERLKFWIQNQAIGCDWLKQDQTQSLETLL